MKRYIRGPNDEVWGTLEDGIYTTKRKRSEHFCIKHQGWGIQESLYDSLIALSSVHTIRIHLIDDGQNYDSCIMDWKHHGIHDTLREEDGPQVFLNKRFFHDSRQAQQKLI